MIKKIVCLFVMFSACIAKEPVLIITYAFNRPEFIEWQCRTFEKFLSDEYRFVVFNDAPPGPNYQAIIESCKKWGIECFDIPQEIHNRVYNEDELMYSSATRRHTDAIQFSLETIGYAHRGTVVIFDGDIFMIRPFSFEEMLEGVDVASVFRVSCGQVPYLWPGLCILAMDRLEDKTDLKFYSGKVNGCYVDSGGMTNHYLTSHPFLKIKKLDQVFGFQIYCPDHFGDYDNILPQPYTPEKGLTKAVRRSLLIDKGFSEDEVEFLLKKPDTINFACNNCFLHYKASSGWDGAREEYNIAKTALFKEFIETILSR